jgi:hypothetical protein
MPKQENWANHTVVEHDHERVLGCITQNPESTHGTPGGLRATGTVADVARGQEFTLLARVGIDENSPAAATTYRTPFFTAKSAPFKFRVLEIGFEVVDLTVADFTDADAGNLDVTVIRGDGAASEVESDVLADFAMDDDYANGAGARFPNATVVLANNEVVAGGSLYADLVVDPDATAGATNDGAMVDVWCRCIRIE